MNTERMVDTKPETLFIRQLPLGPMKNFVYVMGAPESKDVVVVDPAWDVPALLKFVEAAEKRVAAVLLTHGHGDHLNGVAPLLKVLDVPVYAQQAEVQAFDSIRDFGSAVKPVSAGTELELAGLHIRCVHTPGHTPGSQCFHVRDSLISGDTVFVNACGRCDMKGGNAEQMFDSLHRVIGGLPPQTRLFPGHDYGDVAVSSVEREKAHNPYFQLTELSSFVAHRMRPR